MPDYVVLRCPFCKYTWARREERMPVSCPKCKKRFDYRGSTAKLEDAEVTAESYSALGDWLIEANRLSMQSQSMEEVQDKMERI